jgi:hypothetical protein
MHFSPTGSDFFYCNNSPKLGLKWCPRFFAIEADSIYCAYQIDYGKYSLPESVLEENAYEKNPMVIYGAANGGNWVASTGFVQENSDYLFFQSLMKY